MLEEVIDSVLDKLGDESTVRLTLRRGHFPGAIVLSLDSVHERKRYTLSREITASERHGTPRGVGSRIGKRLVDEFMAGIAAAATTLARSTRKDSDG